MIFAFYKTKIFGDLNKKLPEMYLKKVLSLADNQTQSYKLLIRHANLCITVVLVPKCLVVMIVISALTSASCSNICQLYQY